LNKFIPYPPDEVYFDYTILKEINSSQNYILLAAAKKDYIDSILDSFKKKGVLISEITLDSISLINLYLDRYPESKKINCCVLDIGHSFSTMNILEKGVPFFSREAKFSAKDVVEIITRIKDLSEKEAGKVLFSLEKNDDLFTLLEENISDWCKEIKNSFDFFELNKGKNLDKLYLSGGLASIPGIADIFSENLEMDTKVLQPDKSGSLKFSETFPNKEYEKYKHNLAVSFGLVL
jgi:type IV pilus assembly protein PilM